MTVSPRRQRIESMLADDPQDQFLRYSLAMELEKEGDHDRSLSLLPGLTEDAEPYAAAFFMAAKQLVPLGRLDEARQMLRAGIDHARNAGDSHMASEMSEFLTTLGQLG
jgi:thioredoxin-like negative regulator of GroEL